MAHLKSRGVSRVLSRRCEPPGLRVLTADRPREGRFSYPKLTQVLHPDFADCSALAETLLGRDAAIYCLGTYMGAVSDILSRTVRWRGIHFQFVLPHRPLHCNEIDSPPLSGDVFTVFQTCLTAHLTTISLARYCMSHAQNCDRSRHLRGSCAAVWIPVAGFLKASLSGYSAVLAGWRAASPTQSCATMRHGDRSSQIWIMTLAGGKSICLSSGNEPS